MQTSGSGGRGEAREQSVIADSDTPVLEAKFGQDIVVYTPREGRYPKTFCCCEVCSLPSPSQKFAFRKPLLNSCLKMVFFLLIVPCCLEYCEMSHE